MTESRTDALTGETTIYALPRAGRPHDLPAARGTGAHDSARACPFCPGHEDRLLSIEDEAPPLRGDDDARRAGWQTRAVPNRFPLLDATTRPLAGRHEVIVEHPRHDLTLSAMTPDAVAAVVAAWQGRLRALAAIPGIRAVTLFRNQGPAAGTSLAHPHSQVIATPFVPPGTRARTARARRHARRTGDCLACREIAREIDENVRVIAATEPFVALVPYAARAAGAFRVFPLAHGTRFADLGNGPRAGLAALLRACLRRLEAAFGATSWNLVLHDPPRGRRRDDPAAHWHLDVVPRGDLPGGFEMEAAVHVCAVLPEKAAARLRAVRVNIS